MSWKHRWAGWNRGMRRYDKGNGSYGYAPQSSFTGTFTKAWFGLLFALSLLLVAHGHTALIPVLIFLAALLAPFLLAMLALRR